MGWEPIDKIVKARVGQGQVELVNTEIWDPDTGSVVVLWPAPDPSESGIQGPDIRRTEIAAGDWWEPGSDPDDTGNVEAFGYYTEDLGVAIVETSAVTARAQRTVFHRAVIGSTQTLCHRNRSTLQTMATAWDPVPEPLLCGDCSNVKV